MFRGDRNPKKGKSPTKEMTPKSGRMRSSRGNSFRIQGQGYCGLSDGAAAASSGSAMAMHALPAEREYDETESGTDYSNPLLVDELHGINRTLEKQIETLRLRLEYDSKHHDTQKKALLAETESKLKTKADEIANLKEQLNIKDSTIRSLAETNSNRDHEIADLRNQIESLNIEVHGAKSYAEELVVELRELTKQRDMMAGSGSMAQRDKEISFLRKEVSDLKTNLSTLEKELTKAREVITTQTGTITFMESDKKAIQLKFKEELAKVSYSMRLEVEKMRDVMKKQWEEMRSLREQNHSMSKDIKDIRSLLINGCLDDDAKSEQQQQQQPEGQVQANPPGPPSPQVPLPQSARGGKNVYNSYNMGVLKPSLPALSKDNKKVVRRK